MGAQVGADGRHVLCEQLRLVHGEPDPHGPQGAYCHRRAAEEAGACVASMGRRVFAFIKKTQHTTHTCIRFVGAGRRPRRQARADQGAAAGGQPAAAD